MNIVNNSVLEDRYIAHLAGMKEGLETINLLDRWNAYGAKKHPIRNQILSSLSTLNGPALTALGLLAYPVVNSTMRDSIFGSAWSVCTSCGSNYKSLLDQAINLDRLFGNQVPTDLEQKFATTFFGGLTPIVCAADDKHVLSCRGINYVGSVLNTVTDNYLIIGGIAAALAGWYYFSSMNSFNAQECKIEENLKNELSDRFGKIATRLTSLETNPEIQECATKILQRQLEINHEIESLQLPSLRWKDIEQITQPVFDAAKKIIEKK